MVGLSVVAPWCEVVTLSERWGNTRRMLTTSAWSADVYPGLMESIEARDYANGLKWAGIIDRCVARAAAGIR